MAIHRAVYVLSGRYPKIDAFANCLAVKFRNGDGDRILITFDHDTKPSSVDAKISQAFKVKAENQPSQDSLDKLTGS